jgi:hypothetical protein
MVYDSNIKDYQNNIVDNPSSDSNVNLSEVNSQPGAPADNDEDLAQNAREDELEDEANRRIDNLNNALDQEETLAEKIGVVKEDIDDSLVVNEKREILNTRDNVEKIVKDMTSGPRVRFGFTPCELEAEKEIVKINEDEVSNLTE